MGLFVFSGWCLIHYFNNVEPEWLSRSLSCHCWCLFGLFSRISGWRCLCQKWPWGASATDWCGAASISTERCCSRWMVVSAAYRRPCKGVGAGSVFSWHVMPPRASCPLSNQWGVSDLLWTKAFCGCLVLPSIQMCCPGALYLCLIGHY